MHILTGMHRSGTSFLAQLLNFLEADFGNPNYLFPSDKWNQNGYFENMDILDINNRMILGQNAKIDFWLRENEKLISRVKNSFLSCKWKYLLFPSLDGIQHRARTQRTAIKKIHKEYKNKFVKDPRFCLTLEAWRQLGPIESLVFIYRHPSLVAGSLARREGLPLFFGYRYWLYHVQNFFCQLHDGDDLFLIDFDAFFDTQTHVQAFSNVSGWLTGETPEQEQMMRLRNVLNLSLRTQTEFSIPPQRSVREIYNALRVLETKCKGAFRVHRQSDIVKKIAGE